LCPHIEKAKHNTEFSASLIDTKFADWLIIGSFYIALQYVDAHAVRNKVKFEYLPGEETLHSLRRNYVRGKLRHLFTAYERLFQESMNARYDPIYLKRIKFNPKDLFDLSQKFADIV
jgi:hypothetical protein